MAMAGALSAPCLPFRLAQDSCISSSTSTSSSRLHFSPLSPSRQLLVASRALSTTLCRSGLSYTGLWNGRSHLGDIEMFRLARGNLWQLRRRVAGRVQASLLGVGAPEALVIAVVALVVFGPKGLAEVARTLGKSLKAFQPTIQELQQVSREFKSTLEQEIGLDELRNPKPTDAPPTFQQQSPVQQPRVQNGAPETRAYTTEDSVRVTEEQAKALVPEDLRREAEASAWGGSPPGKGTERAAFEQQRGSPPGKGTERAAFEQQKPEDES